jgi:hypothetical protein
MLCPLCQKRKARRTCPALGRQICSVCCGTKRRTEIQCPADCTYLVAAREHPAAVVVRRQQHDLGWLVSRMHDLGERQSKLFFLVCSFLARDAAGDGRHTLAPYEEGPPGIAASAVIDADAADALGAIAATLETAVRGVIYEHRPASRPAERLVAALKPVLTEVGAGGGTAFERDAAVVLRRIEAAARDMMKESPGHGRAFLDLLDRVIRKPGDAAAGDAGAPEPSRLILP